MQNYVIWATVEKVAANPQSPEKFRIAAESYAPLRMTHRSREMRSCTKYNQ
jgi:hypothetical protein